jgi:predicted DNA-binding protein
MVSRSFRITPEVMDKLKKEAKTRDLGVTVLIRKILEAHVETEEFLELLANV